MSKKNWKKAKQTLTAIAQKHPNNHIVACDLAKCAYEDKDFECAKKYAQNALAIFPDFKDALNIIKKMEHEND